MRMLAAVVVVIGAVIAPAPAGAMTRQEVIKRAFAEVGAAAAPHPERVASCESAGDRSGRVIRPWATNGQFLGAFQLGAWARSRFLRGPWYGLWANARAAGRLWLANHHSWYGQWSCSWAAS